MNIFKKWFTKNKDERSQQIIDNVLNIMTRHCLNQCMSRGINLDDIKDVLGFCDNNIYEYCKKYKNFRLISKKLTLHVGTDGRVITAYKTDNEEREKREKEYAEKSTSGHAKLFRPSGKDVIIYSILSYIKKIGE